MTTPIADEVARMHADAKSRNESAKGIRASPQVRVKC
jgi:hypothetical protein